MDEGTKPGGSHQVGGWAVVSRMQTAARSWQKFKFRANFGRLLAMDVSFCDRTRGCAARTSRDRRRM